MHYDFFQNLVYLWIAMAVAVFFLLLRVTAPYGRHTTTGWGPLINNRLGWVLMEMPAVILLVYYMALNGSSQNAISWTLAGFYIFHYVHRTFIYPFRIHTKGKKMPLIIAVSGIFFNLINGFFLGYYFSHFAVEQVDTFFMVHFGVGLVLFVSGLWINWAYDNRLIHLRPPGDTSYKIPFGGLFRYVSCPNLLGEIIEWLGYAVMCWHWPALSFLVWTLANLVPRALSHHRWYRSHFEDYPNERKALFPFVL